MKLGFIIVFMILATSCATSTKFAYYNSDNGITGYSLYKTDQTHWIETTDIRDWKSGSPKVTYAKFVGAGICAYRIELEWKFFGTDNWISDDGCKGFNAAMAKINEAGNTRAPASVMRG